MLGIKFEHECYDVGHLYNLKFCLDQGYFQTPIFLQFVMGTLGGIGADIERIIAVLRQIGYTDRGMFGHCRAFVS